MTKTIQYTYLGENGTVSTSVYLEGIYFIKKYILTPDEGKVLVKNGVIHEGSATVLEKDLPQWTEIDNS